MINYLKRLMDSRDPASIRRFTIVIALTHYVISSFVILFIRVTIANEQLLREVMLYDMLIILMGVFGLTIQQVFQLLLKKASILATVTSRPNVTVENAENVTSTSTEAGVVNTENVETVVTRDTNLIEEEKD